MVTYEAIPLAIRTAVDSLPASMLKRSGSIFYSGKEAFAKQGPLYILGLNPGGIPSDVPSVTIADYNEQFRARDKPWSAYSDDSWEDAPAGSYPLQRHILHMLGQLGLDPRMVPSSNIVFVQSRSEGHLGQEKTALLEACWPFHQAVITSLGISTVVCFGATAGMWARKELGAVEQIDSYTETNNRGWTSWTHRNPDGLQVVTVTHPSRAYWTNPLADPTPLVKRALARS